MANTDTDVSFIERLDIVLAQHLANEKFGVEELVREMGMSRTQLHRKLQQHTGKSASQQIREFRLEKGRELLEQGEMSVSEVAFAVGFNSATYFNTCFTELYGYTPGEAKNNTTKKPVGYALDYKRLALPVLITLALLLMYSISSFFRSESYERISIAVLPFSNDSPDANNDYFCWGIMGSITNNLARVHDFGKVIPRASVEKYHETAKDARSIAAELEVSHLLSGSVRKYGENIRVNVQLIDVQSDPRIIWSDQFDGNSRDAMKLESTIALEVADQLKIALTMVEENLIKANEEVDFESYDLHFLAEQYLRNASRSNPALLDSAAMVARTILERDPRFLPAYNTLFECFSRQLTWENRLFRPQKRLDSLASTMKMMGDINPEARNYLLLKAEYLLELQSGEEAAEIYRELLADHPYSIDLHEKHSYAYRIENPAKSIRYQFRTLKLFPYLKEDKSFIRDLGMKYLRIDYLDRAESIANYLVLRFPDYIEGWNMLFEISALREDFEAMSQYADSVCAKDEDSRYCIVATITDLARHGQYSEMVDFLSDFERDKGRWEQAWHGFLLACFYPYALYKSGNEQYEERAAELAFIYEKGLQEQTYQKHYNYWFLAQNHACNRSKDKCLEYLQMMEEEIKMGQFFFTFMQFYPNLDPVRNEPEFIAMIDRIKKQRTIWREEVIRYENDGVIDLPFLKAIQ